MCNHSYKNFSINKKNHKCQLDINENRLPIDSDGKCIFHSEDKSWKQFQDFTTYLRTYITHCRENKKEIDLREVHFVSSKGKTEIDYIDMLVNANIEGAQFHNLVLMIGKKTPKQINGILNFNHCFFFHDVIFRNCVFCSEVVIKHISQRNDFGVLNFQIEDSVFEYFFEFNDPLDFCSNLRISNCEFKEYAQFEQFFKQENTIEIVENRFLKNFTFLNSEIDALCIDFSNNTFKGDAKFTDVSFRGVEILFNNLVVDSKLLFTGTSERKVFYGNTQFAIEPNVIRGQIVFQQVNLMLIEANDLEQIRKLEKIGEGEIKKVIIGAGCIKYRWQSPLKTLKVGMKNAFIIEEFVRTFTIFLSNGSQKVIGIDVIERSNSEIAFFYFSDEYCRVDQINELLFEGREEFFRIISNQSSSDSRSIAQSDLLNNFQTKLSQNASIIKILSEMQQQNWSLNDTQALLNAFAFEGETLLSAKPFHLQLEKTDLSEILKISQQQQIPINLILLTLNTAETMITIDQMNGNNNIYSKE